MSSRPTLRTRRHALIAALAYALCLPASATGTPTVTLKAGLHPEHLGGTTTIKFAFSIAFAHSEAPLPLRVIELRYPAHLGIAASGIGLTTCRPAALEAQGPPGCPSTSVMGYGSGLVEVPFANQTLYEPVQLTTFMGTLHGEHPGFLFFASGEIPVFAGLVFQGVALPSKAPFGGDLQTHVPLIPTWPEGPDVILTKFATTLGPEHITYWEYDKSHYIPYHPRGIELPPGCPRGGFPFAVALTFVNGARADAHTAVPCPGRNSGPVGTHSARSSLAR